MLSGGEALEDHAMERAQAGIHKLLQTEPGIARRIDQHTGEVSEVPATALCAGDDIEIRQYEAAQVTLAGTAASSAAGTGAASTVSSTASSAAVTTALSAVTLTALLLTLTVWCQQPLTNVLPLCDCCSGSGGGCV